MNPSIDPGELDACLRQGIGLIAYSPLAQGRLTGKYRLGQPIPMGSRGSEPNSNKFIGSLLNDGCLRMVEGFIKVVDTLGVPLPQLALVWVLAQPGVRTALIGASRPEQLDINAGYADVRLDGDVMGMLGSVMDDRR